MQTHSNSIRARWVFLVDAEPIENGTVEIDSGRISSVHSRHDDRSHDLGNAAIIPGLVNAHTHFEFSELEQPLAPAEPFTDWIRTLVGHRRSRGIEPVDAIRRGYDESQRTGTTLVGEIATDGWSASAFSDMGPTVVAFRELIGLLPEQADSQVEIAQRHLQAGSSDAGNIVRGISPHAPYSVHPDLYHRLVGLAAGLCAPLAIHLAETRAELQLLIEGTGPLADMLQQFGIWRDDLIPRGSRPMDYLTPLARLDRALVVHGNYLDEAEAGWLAQHPRVAVVYCPRTHAYFGHTPHPWRRLLAQGVSLAIGTDSRASNPDLSIWNELAFLHERHPDVDPRLLLELGTLAGARALGFADAVGTIAAGKSADLAVVSLADSAETDPYAQLFRRGNCVTGTMRGGDWIAGPAAKEPSRKNFPIS